MFAREMRRVFNQCYKDIVKDGTLYSALSSISERFEILLQEVDLERPFKNETPPKPVDQLIKTEQSKAPA